FAVNIHMLTVFPNSGINRPWGYELSAMNKKKIPVIISCVLLACQRRGDRTNIRPYCFAR
ncbi:hypothetical protein, partial [Enterocloster sp.]|uniref:hypothetical protein n=1 Tax=Enterocloster sp. TaxID=2719315 RepID=UPI003991EF89